LLKGKYPNKRKETQKEGNMTLYASWVHGNSFLLERVGAPRALDRSSVRDAFRGGSGDIVGFGGYGGAACLRIGWAARFVIYDTGNGNLRKSGSFWCHYAIPTPVIEAGKRAEADTVLINYESTDINQISISAVHVWDGNKRIFADNGPPSDPDDFNGGISRYTTNAGVTPNGSKLYRGNIRRRPIYFGIGVSLRIRAHAAMNNNLEIRGVGIDFQI
jgi:hypothetical protein